MELHGYPSAYTCMSILVFVLVEHEVQATGGPAIKTLLTSIKWGSITTKDWVD